MRESAMRGPVSQTTGPSSIHELSLELLIVEVRHRDLHATGPEEELDPRQLAQLRGPSRGDATYFEELEGQEELGFASELLRRLARGQQDAVRQIELDSRHIQKSTIADGAL